VTRPAAPAATDNPPPAHDFWRPDECHDCRDERLATAQQFIRDTDRKDTQ
jgi:hypothetical protein